jgi:putative transposase
MRGPQPPQLELTARQQDILSHLIQRSTAPQRLVLRARLILLAASGRNNSYISQELSLDRGQVRLWRSRWLAAQAQLTALEHETPGAKPLTNAICALLTDAPRPGTPPRFSPEQIVQVVAVACEPPAASGRPISHWTTPELADEVVKRGIVETISARSVGRFLK